MKIIIGSDHGGFELKEYLKNYLIQKGIKYKDAGTVSNKSCDYPDFAKIVGVEVGKGNFEKGVLICTTGIGMSITANKFKNVRAALCYNVDASKFSRLHNDANVLVLGAKYVGKGLAGKILKAFLKTDFDAGRHEKRVNKIKDIEKSL